jgi:hypothetical protein
MVGPEWDEEEEAETPPWQPPEEPDGMPWSAEWVPPYPPPAEYYLFLDDLKRQSEDDGA